MTQLKMRNGKKESRFKRCTGKTVTEIPASINYIAIRKRKKSNGSHPIAWFWVIMKQQIRVQYLYGDLNLILLD